MTVCLFAFDSVEDVIWSGWQISVWYNNEQSIHYISVVDFQLFPSRSFSQLEVLQVPELSLCIMISRVHMVLYKGCAAHHLGPISTGNNHAFHPFFWHGSWSSVFLVDFLSWACSHLDSHELVSSIVIKCLPRVDHSTMSDRVYVWTCVG